MSTEATLERLADRIAIQDLRSNYCYAIDDRDFESLPHLFTEDVSLDYGALGTYQGRDGVRKFADFVAESLERTTHLLANPTISVGVDGDRDRATGRLYVIASITYADGTGGWRIGEYRDEYRRVDGEWRIADAAMRFTHSMDYDTADGWPDFTAHE